MGEKMSIANERLGIRFPKEKDKWCDRCEKKVTVNHVCFKRNIKPKWVKKNER